MLSASSDHQYSLQTAVKREFVLGSHGLEELTQGERHRECGLLDWLPGRRPLARGDSGHSPGFNLHDLGLIGPPQTGESSWCWAKEASHCARPPPTHPPPTNPDPPRQCAQAESRVFLQPAGDPLDLRPALDIAHRHEWRCSDAPQQPQCQPPAPSHHHQQQQHHRHPHHHLPPPPPPEGTEDHSACFYERAQHAARNAQVLPGHTSPGTYPGSSSYSPPGPDLLYASGAFLVRHTGPPLPFHGSAGQPQRTYPKPAFSYSCLIALALKSSKTGSLPVNEIYGFLLQNFPYFRSAPDGWKNSIRHNLSLNKCFRKVEVTVSNIGGAPPHPPRPATLPPSLASIAAGPRKGCLWSLVAERVGRMEQEIHKWQRKDPLGIGRSMVDPGLLERLVPEKPATPDPVPSFLSRALPAPPPACARSPAPPSCWPGAHCAHPPAARDPARPAGPGHQPPLRPRRGGGRGEPPGPPAESPLRALAPAPCEPPPLSHIALSCAGAAADAEIDALQPSITDFALQGDFWEILREETFGLGAMQSLSAHVHSSSSGSGSSHYHHSSTTSDLHAELGLTSELHSDFYDFGLIPEL